MLSIFLLKYWKNTFFWVTTFIILKSFSSREWKIVKSFNIRLDSDDNKVKHCEHNVLCLLCFWYQNIPLHPFCLLCYILKWQYFLIVFKFETRCFHKRRKQTNYSESTYCCFLSQLVSAYHQSVPGPGVQNMRLSVDWITFRVHDVEKI